MLPNKSDRRKFIFNITSTGAVIILNPIFSWAKYNQEDQVLNIINNMMAIDTHNHIDVPLNANELPGPNIDINGMLKESGFSLICMTFAVDYQKLSHVGEAFDKFMIGLDAMDEALKKNKMQRALNYQDIQSANKNKQAIVIQSVEGGHFLEGNIERVQIAYKRGLRHLGLLHDSDASTPLGDVYTNVPQFGGLTPFGIQVINECNRLGIVIDLTHCSNEAINMAIKISKHPMVISHTGLDTQLGEDEHMANIMKPRLISKEQAKIFAQAGGILGVWTHLSQSPLSYAKKC
jgi:membrane dipeptidase